MKQETLFRARSTSSFDVLISDRTFVGVKPRALLIIGAKAWIHSNPANKIADGATSGGPPRCPGMVALPVRLRYAHQKFWENNLLENKLETLDSVVAVFGTTLPKQPSLRCGRKGR